MPFNSAQNCLKIDRHGHLSFVHSFFLPGPALNPKTLEPVNP